jgi:hypothetical protein
MDCCYLFTFVSRMFRVRVEKFYIYGVRRSHIVDISRRSLCNFSNTISPPPNTPPFTIRSHFELPKGRCVLLFCILYIAIPSLHRWYPKHMSGSLRKIEAQTSSSTPIDCIIEVHDARIPITGRNTTFEEKLTNRAPHILVFNKQDLVRGCLFVCVFVSTTLFLQINPSYMKHVDEILQRPTSLDWRARQPTRILWTQCKDKAVHAADKLMHVCCLFIYYYFLLFSDNTRRCWCINESHTCIQRNDNWYTECWQIDDY